MVENKNVIMWIEENILYGIYKKNSIIDLQAALEIVELRMTLSKGKTFKAIIDGRNIGNVTKQARAYFAGVEGCKGIEKAALLIDSNWSKILANLFLQVNKPIVTMKAFTDKNEAEKWLNIPSKRSIDKPMFIY
jgi:hypothetical protein